MAHTCSVCGAAARLVAAPTADGTYETVHNPSKHARKLNRRYRHNRRSWKRQSKACKQWARHEGRLPRD